MVDVLAPEIGFIGVFGAVLTLSAWVPQTLRTIRTKRTGLEPKFIAIYFFGSLLLAVYSYLIADIVFLILNAASTAMAAVNADYYWRFERRRRRG
jgi:MtN3 and saliva related transmembrane protein